MQFELPSAIDLAVLTKVIHSSETKLITNAFGFENITGCIKNIKVHTDSLNPILVYLADELVELGTAVNGEYSVFTFRNVPFPYAAFPILTIQHAGNYRVSYESVEYDMLLSHCIYNFGAFHKVSNVKYLHMYQRDVQLTKSAKSDLSELTEAAKLDNFVVLKCSDFDKVIATPGFEWVKERLFPGISSFYSCFSKLPLNYCLIFEKTDVAEFIDLVHLRCPDVEVRISRALPTKVMEKNKHLIGNVLNYLIYSLTK